jgi:aspartyl/asparaginyl beta-hydroxylase (cupin superfamily)
VSSAVEHAIGLLLRGDAAGSRRAFEALRTSEAADFRVHLGLASACMSLHDPAAASRAIDAALELDPRDLRALVLKGDALLHLGDPAAAVAFHSAALRVAGDPAQWPPELRGLIQRAADGLDRFRQGFEQRLRQATDDASRRHGPPSARFVESLDLLTGRRQRYEQRPTRYYLPELPTIAFFERSAFPWIPALEAQTAAIRDELRAVMQGPQAFSPYVAIDRSRPVLNDASMVGNPDWSAYDLWKDGVLVAEHAARCPRTVVAMEQVPLTRIPGRSPNVLFSLLRPGAHIPAHHGFLNTRLIVHLPLIVPPGCRFRVGNQTREWVEGQAWVFDDTIEHEAWNDSGETRVVLLFEVWRPELDEAERAHVSALFEAIDGQAGAAGRWGL